LLRTLQIRLEERLKILQEDIEHYNDLGTTLVERLTGVLKAVHQAVGELKYYVLTEPFEDQAEEIRFFKHGMPRFLAERIYALEVYTVESHKPLSDELLLKAYYESELRVIKRFFDQHRFLYQYYLLDGSELDETYFLRGGRRPCFSCPMLGISTHLFLWRATTCLPNSSRWNACKNT
jgi:hypothetical protein